MKKILIFIIIITASNSYSQELNETTFDFWVGDWELTWKDAKGNAVTGENNIVKILGDKVIQENFSDPINKYTGMSLSIFNPKTNTWNQTWVDSGGSHFNFTGKIIDGNPVFETEMVEKNQQRMVFKNITENGFNWIWEGTRNGGESWGTLWEINYVRK